MAKQKHILAGFVLDDSEKAHALLKTLQEIDVKDDDVKIVDAAFAHKNKDGKISLEQTTDMTGGKGALGGALVTALAGAAVAGPVGLVVGGALGAGLSGLYGRLRDTGVDDKYMKDLARKLEPGKTILYILYEGEWTGSVAAFANALLASGVVHVYTTLPPEASAVIQQAVVVAAAERAAAGMPEEAPAAEEAPHQKKLRPPRRLKARPLLRLKWMPRAIR